LHGHQRHQFSAPEADFASTTVASGLWRAVVTIAFTANAAAHARALMIAPTLCGSVIWSRHETMTPSVQRIDIGERLRGIGVRQI